MNDEISTIETGTYGFRKTTEMPFVEAVERIKETLKDEGFGILTEIDLKEKFKEKLDKDFGNYLILGACNPGFAYEALGMEIDLGLLLPCNAVVYEKDGKTVVGLVDAERMLSVTNRTDMGSFAEEVNERLKRALAKF